MNTAEARADRGVEGTDFEEPVGAGGRPGRGDLAPRRIGGRGRTVGVDDRSPPGPGRAVIRGPLPASPRRRPDAPGIGLPAGVADAGPPLDRRTRLRAHAPARPPHRWIGDVPGGRVEAHGSPIDPPDRPGAVARRDGRPVGAIAVDET